MMVWTTLRSKAQKRLMVYLIVAAAICAGAYLGVFWNRSGGIAEPAQAVKSVIEPDQRDYASNLYRDQENENLRYTIGFSPIIGIGFGRPFAVINQMVDLTNIWSLQHYMPHNNILWLWMRMGIVGFVIFWVTAGVAVLLVVACVRLGGSRLRELLEEERAQGPETPGMRKAAFRGVSTERVSRHIIVYEPHMEQEAQVGHAPIATGKLNKRTRRAEMQECAEFLVLAFLGQACMVSWLALAVADQGLMSYRLSAYVGLILGTLTSAWTIYHAKYSPALSRMIREELPEREEKPRAKRQRMRVLTGA
jgi:O-antigen ligase